MGYNHLHILSVNMKSHREGIISKSWRNSSVAKQGLILNNQDPTKSKVLRQKYSAEMYKRWRKVKSRINEVLIEQDALDLTDKKSIILPNAKKKLASNDDFEFSTDGEKVDSFMSWLRKVQDKEVLEVMERDGRDVVARREWQNVYVKSGFKKGLKHANTQLRKLGYDIPDESLERILNKPIHADKLGMLYTRNFRELEGITEAVDQQISRELAEGLGKGENPKKIASRLNNRVDKIGITRSRTLARTEIVRAHSESTLNRFEEYGMEEVKIKAEWSTAGDSRVCELCEPKDGEVYVLSEARGLIPFHPNCRCAWLPKTS